MTWTLDHSFAVCQRLARQTAKNFYYSFLVLPRAKRRAMCALYAFLRHTDDLGDGSQPVEARRAALVEWRRSLDRALAGEFDQAIFPALADTVACYDIPPGYLHAVIDGVEMDLDERTYETFDDLADYCYKVASVVGLVCIHIWGFRGVEALEPARKCGIAFQLTNILRDLKEDAGRGRVYLPQVDLRRFEYTLDDLRSEARDGRFTALMHFEIDRAEHFYRDAAELHAYLEPDGQAIYGAMTAIYHALLVEIKRRDGDVFSSRVSLSAWRKLGIAARWLLPRPATRAPKPSLGATRS